MSERQRLIYDLSMQCALAQIIFRRDNTTSIEAQILDAFASSVKMYALMDNSALEDALRQVKMV